MARTEFGGEMESLAKGLTAVLNREVSWRRRERFEVVSTLVGLGASPTVFSLPPALGDPALEPLPAETLVELLKHPLCVGEARRATLDALGTCYHRTFADQWDFVRFADKEKLGFDFTSPPKRP